MIRPRLSQGHVIVSPHQDDEWLGCAQTFKNLAGPKLVIIVTKSLWPSNSSYGIRQLESDAAVQELGGVADYIGLNEEDLFDPPYDPLNYVGASMEATFAPVLAAQLTEFMTGKDVTNIFYPSVDDAAFHVVHGFCRNITLQALSGLGGFNIRRYEYNIYAEPTSTRRSVCDASWKFPGFQRLYPTQWEILQKDGWAFNQVDLHCTYEYIQRV
jgi:LmbE family N-acetylglucosaminyl deacetylase